MTELPQLAEQSESVTDEQPDGQHLSPATQLVISVMRHSTLQCCGSPANVAVMHGLSDEQDIKQLPSHSSFASTMPLPQVGPTPLSATPGLGSDDDAFASLRSLFVCASVAASLGAAVVIAAFVAASWLVATATEPAPPSGIARSGEDLLPTPVAASPSGPLSTEPLSKWQYSPSLLVPAGQLRLQAVPPAVAMKTIAANANSRIVATRISAPACAPRALAAVVSAPVHRTSQPRFVSVAQQTPVWQRDARRDGSRSEET